MSATSSDRSDHIDGAERLRRALGWEHLPELTPEQEAEYREANQRAQDEARRFYGEQRTAA